MALPLPRIEPLNTNVKDNIGRAVNVAYNGVMGNYVNIEVFRSKFMGANARSYLFLCNFTFPDDVLPSGNIKKTNFLTDTIETAINIVNPIRIESPTKNNDYKFFVKSSSLPEVTIEETSSYWLGQQIKMASVRRTSDWNVTFLVNDDASILEKFWNWHKKMHDPVKNEYGFHQHYMIDQSIQLLGIDGFPICTYMLFGAWPKSIGQVDLDYSNNEFATVDISFTYQYLTVTRDSLSAVDSVRKFIRSAQITSKLI